MVSEVTGESLATQKEISAEQKKFLTEVLTYYREFASEKVDDEQSRARTASAQARVGHIEYRLGRKEDGVAALRLAQAGIAIAQTMPVIMRGDATVTSWYPSILPQPNTDTIARIAAMYAADPLALHHELELSNWQLDPVVAPDAFASAKAQTAGRMTFAAPAPPPKGVKPLTASKSNKAAPAAAPAKTN